MMYYQRLIHYWCYQPRWLSGLKRSRVHSLMIARRSLCPEKLGSNPGQGSKGINFLGLAWSRYVRYCDKETLNSNKPNYWRYDVLLTSDTLLTLWRTLWHTINVWYTIDVMTYYWCQDIFFMSWRIIDVKTYFLTSLFFDVIIELLCYDVLLTP